MLSRHSVKCLQSPVACVHVQSIDVGSTGDHGKGVSAGLDKLLEAIVKVASIPAFTAL
jgi:hypothetical protein